MSVLFFVASRPVTQGFVVQLLSETTSAVTLGWTPVPGALGYRFNSEKQTKPSHTWDPARSSVKFAKGSSWYEVQALMPGPTDIYP